MRTILAFLPCLFFAAVLQAQLPVTSGSNANPFLSDAKENSIDDLRAAIVKYDYKWGGGNESIRFTANGGGQHMGGTTHFDILWHVKNAQEIEITRADNRDPSAKARIKFSADYTTFTGVDFGGGRAVDGFQIIPKTGATPGTGASDMNVKTFTGTNDDLRKGIVQNFYTWESASDGGKKKTIRFDANGNGIQSDFHFKWRIINPQEIEIVAVGSISGNKKAVLDFSADYSTYTGTDFDGGALSGRLAPQ